MEKAVEHVATLGFEDWVIMEDGLEVFRDIFKDDIV